MNRLLKFLFVLIWSFAFASCNEEEEWIPTSLRGAVWKLETPMPLAGYYNYEVGRSVAFSGKNERGWIGWSEDDRYKVIFTCEKQRDRKDSYYMVLHTNPNLGYDYYIADVEVVEKRASFFLFDNYNDFYQFNTKGDTALGREVRLVYDRRY